MLAETGMVIGELLGMQAGVEKLAPELLDMSAVAG